MAAFAGTDVFVGSVGRGPGASGSEWFTSVWLHNPGTAPATVVASLLLRNQTNPTPATQTVVVQPGETRRIDNIVETLFGQSNSFGAMRFTSASRIVVNARIYNKAIGGPDSDSNGQSVDGVPASFAIGTGQSTEVLGAHQTNPLDSSQFRYNFGYVETAGGSGVVRVVASDSTGAQVGTKDYSVGPYEARQFGIVDVVPAVNSTNLRLTVSVLSGPARVVAFGSGIANHSNDPTTFEMSFRDDLLAGPAAATNVKHDATLTGDGSDATPLGVANLGVGSAKINSSGGAVGNVLTATAGGAAAWQVAPGLALPSRRTVTLLRPSFPCQTTQRHRAAPRSGVRPLEPEPDSPDIPKAAATEWSRTRHSMTVSAPTLPAATPSTRLQPVRDERSMPLLLGAGLALRCRQAGSA